MAKRTVRERIEQYRVVDEDGCWRWSGYCDYLGYGKIQVAGRSRIVHRVAYEVFRGPIPTGLTLDHLCRKRDCCNPWHLEPTTQRVNTLRGTGPTAVNARKTKCVRGHDFDEVNTFIKKNGGRLCLTCARAQRKAWKQAHR